MTSLRERGDPQIEEWVFKCYRKCDISQREGRKQSPQIEELLLWQNFSAALLLCQMTPSNKKRLVGFSAVIGPSISYNTLPSIPLKKSYHPYLTTPYHPYPLNCLMQSFENSGSNIAKFQFSRIPRSYQFA